MIEKTPNKDLEPFKVSPQIHAEAKVESALTGKTMQSVVEQAWRDHVAFREGQPRPSENEKPTGSGLTDDQIDTLEMLSADWEEEFGFSQIQYLVTAALEKYRARRKTLRPGKPPRRSKAS